MFLNAPNGYAADIRNPHGDTAPHSDHKSKHTMQIVHPGKVHEGTHSIWCYQSHHRYSTHISPRSGLQRGGLLKGYCKGYGRHEGAGGLTVPSPPHARIRRLWTLRYSSSLQGTGRDRRGGQTLRLQPGKGVTAGVPAPTEP